MICCVFELKNMKEISSGFSGKTVLDLKKKNLQREKAMSCAQILSAELFITILS